eukprot:NODE_391_length_1555_cov_120.635854_g359_i0.p1 GENE.NODE_391_length_1555_cov_120.635854_g359_i0~~NODE_391_length_1555_cov_120.635854_g359_i0.p1  ORF type:complete len:408 (-),score=86.33 NODE_391_length_1555_cov_120.635854_g359_i0:263-1486(-)
MSVSSKTQLSAPTEGPQDHTQFEGCSIPAFSSFDEMELDTSLLRGIYGYGWEKPSAIQQRAIVPVKKGGDVIAQAQAGTGKTGAFGVGALARLDFSRNTPQFLALAPTRELAEQICEVMQSIGSFAAKNRPFTCLSVGGRDTRATIQELESGRIVVVGTPGRVLHMVKCGALRCSGLRTVVLDEADEMLSEGLAEQLLQIFQFVPKDVQMCLFSATMPPEVLTLTEKIMRDPVKILVPKEMLNLKAIRQFYVAVEEEYKLETLFDLYEACRISQSIVFVNTVRKAQWLADQMNAKDFSVGLMHAALSPPERREVVKAFRAGSTRVLISTDVLARGIDIHAVSVVVNFELCTDKELYLHRCGRTGRYGKKGIVINFVCSRQVVVQRGLEDHYHVEVSELPLDFADYLD